MPDDGDDAVVAPEPNKYVDFYTAVQVAEVFGVTKRTVLTWIETKKIEAEWTGENFLIPKSEVVRYGQMNFGPSRKGQII